MLPTGFGNILTYTSPIRQREVRATDDLFEIDKSQRNASYNDERASNFLMNDLAPKLKQSELDELITGFYKDLEINKDAKSQIVNDLETPNYAPAIDQNETLKFFDNINRENLHDQIELMQSNLQSVQTQLNLHLRREPLNSNALNNEEEKINSSY